MSGATLSPDEAIKRLSGLLDAAMDGIISVDGNQTVVQYNQAAQQMFGWPAEQILGGPLERLLPERFRASHGVWVRGFGATSVHARRMQGRGGDRMVHGLHRDGHEFPMDASISQIDTAGGKLYTVIVRDITERVRAQQELAAFAAEAAGIREQEKTRIARELHDELAQSLTALKMDALWVRDRLEADPDGARDKLARMLELLDTSVAATRRISADLRPLVLDDLGLAAGIEWLAQRFTERTGVPCALEMDDALDLPEPHASSIFRMVQESLANVAKHADAASVRVEVALGDSDLSLRIVDDGRGFATDAPRKPQSLGLVGLRERAQLLRGKVQVHSTPGQGTVIEVCIPWPPPST